MGATEGGCSIYPSRVEVMSGGGVRLISSKCTPNIHIFYILQSEDVYGCPRELLVL